MSGAGAGAGAGAGWGWNFELGLEFELELELEVELGSWELEWESVCYSMYEWTLACMYVWTLTCINSPGQRPKGVLDRLIACFYSVFFDYWAPPGGLGDLSPLLTLSRPSPDPLLTPSRPPAWKARSAADDS